MLHVVIEMHRERNAGCGELLIHRLFTGVKPRVLGCGPHDSPLESHRAAPAAAPGLQPMCMRKSLCNVPTCQGGKSRSSKLTQASSNKCHASSNRCLTSSNKKLIETSALKRHVRLEPPSGEGKSLRPFRWGSNNLVACFVHFF